MKKISFIFLLISTTLISTAQNIELTGWVKNEKGGPLAYAFVQDEQTRSATYADSTGAFKLAVAPDATLLVSFKGYKEARVKVSSKTSVQVALQPSAAGAGADNTQDRTPSFDVTANDAFTGHTNMSSTYNTSNAVEGGEQKFNGLSFPVMKEKEETHGSRFLYTNWLGGYVTTSKDEQVKNPTFLFKYDKIRGILLLTHDEKSAMEIDQDQLKSFTLYDQQKQPLVFEKVPSIDKVHFMLVLSTGKKYSIYKLTTTKFIKSDQETNGLVTTGNSYDEYADDIKYYVLAAKGGDVQQLSLKKKSIKQVFGDDGDKVDAFIRQHNGDYDENYLKSLGDYLNQ
jgi:CarboxypepD_reg-like domain